MNLIAREVGGIRELLDHNPVVGEPCAGTRRFWTGREEKLLRAHYPTGGVTASGGGYGAYGYRLARVPA